MWCREQRHEVERRVLPTAFGGLRELPAPCPACEEDRRVREAIYDAATNGAEWLMDCRADEPRYVAEWVEARLREVLALDGGVWVFGKIASGKSTLCRAWVRELAGTGKARAVYVSEDDLLGADREQLAEWSEVPALAIDGMGTAIEITAWQRQKLEALIDRRLLGGCTLMTTPIRAKSEAGTLPVTYGDLLLSRCLRFTDRALSGAHRRLYLGGDA